VAVEGRPVEIASDLVSLQRYSVTEDYLHALRLSLVRGRWFTAEDRDGAELVAVISESAASRLFPGKSPLGHRIRTGGDDAPWRSIVGVAGDVQHVDLRGPALPSLYLPISQFVDPFVTLVVRTSLPFERQAEALREIVAETLPDVPTYAVAPLAELKRRSAGLERFTSNLLGSFAAIALLLSTIGLYGLIAYLVEARRREVGIRVALGADRGSVAWLVLRQGTGLALSGLAFGTAGALLLAQALEGLLFDVHPGDPASLVGVAAALFVVTLLAQLGPLRRALRLDPAQALRTEG
jgi:putative ABC transport system permease protein